MARHTVNLSVLARELGISRQAVSRLVQNRDRTGFPEPENINGYNVDAVKKWYLTFDPKRGPKAGIKKS